MNQYGSFSLCSVKAGEFALDGGAMFGIIPKPLWEKTNPADDKNRITLFSVSLYIEHEVNQKKRKILIDTGIGEKSSDRDRKIYRINNSVNIRQGLSELSISPLDITDVIITHLHFDHAGGTTHREENNTQLSFPNAIHHIQRAHLDRALSPTERDSGSFIINDYDVLKGHDKLNLIEGDAGLFPGIEVIECNGHTQSMQVVKISTEEQVFLYCADLIPTSSHIPLPYIMGYDLHPLSTLEEKKKLLKKAFEERWVLIFEHDPVVRACFVDKVKGKFIPGKLIDI